MRTTLSLFAASLLAASAASAQANFEGVLQTTPDDSYGSISFIGRNGGGSGQFGVQIMQELPAGRLENLGFDRVANQCENTGVRYVLQDQDLTTTENYTVVLRQRDAATQTGPDNTANGILAQSGALSLPSGTMGGAFIVTLAWTNPVVVPCASDYFVGVDLPANANWPASDGLSIQYCDYTGGALGDNPATGAPGLAWTSDNDPQLGLSQPTQQTWTTSIAPFFGTPVLQLGASFAQGTGRTNPASSHPDASYGAAGFFPDVARGDGISFRIWSNSNQGGSAAVFLSTSTLPSPVPFGFAQGALALDPSVLLSFPVTTTIQQSPGSPALFPAGLLPDQQVALFDAVPPGVIPASAAGASFPAQALAVGTLNAFTNVVQIEL